MGMRNKFLWPQAPQQIIELIESWPVGAEDCEWRFRLRLACI
jgi:hypothetical protein